MKRRKDERKGKELKEREKGRREPDN